MTPARLELEPGVVLDGRRALWLEPERAIVVADLHIGYPWVQRQRGLLLPVEVPDETTARLASLVDDYRPAQLVFLGDLVHASVPLPALTRTLTDLLIPLANRTSLVLVLGNHDHRLDVLLERHPLPLRLCDSLALGPHRLVHGHETSPDLEAFLATRPPSGRLILGHEHPVVRLPDRVVRGPRCPCFIEAEDRLVLPAFSDWAAGCDVQGPQFFSGWDPKPVWRSVIPILGPRLLRIPWYRLR